MGFANEITHSQEVLKDIQMNSVATRYLFVFWIFSLATFDCQNSIKNSLAASRYEGVFWTFTGSRHDCTGFRTNLFGIPEIPSMTDAMCSEGFERYARAYIIVSCLNIRITKSFEISDRVCALRIFNNRVVCWLLTGELDDKKKIEYIITLKDYLLGKKYEMIKYDSVRFVDKSNRYLHATWMLLTIARRDRHEPKILSKKCSPWKCTSNL